MRHFRYADDLLLLASDSATAVRGVQAVRDWVARRGLRLRSGCPAPASLVQGVPWLGVTIHRRPFCWDGKRTYGYDVPEDKVAKLLATLDEMTPPPSERLDADVVNLPRWIVSINDQLRHRAKAYVFADNAALFFRPWTNTPGNASAG